VSNRKQQEKRKREKKVENEMLEFLTPGKKGN
jgi:hypothetical protein